MMPMANFQNSPSHGGNGNKGSVLAHPARGACHGSDGSDFAKNRPAFTPSHGGNGNKGSVLAHPARGACHGSDSVNQFTYNVSLGNILDRFLKPRCFNLMQTFFSATDRRYCPSSGEMLNKHSTSDRSVKKYRGLGTKGSGLFGDVIGKILMVLLLTVSVRGENWKLCYDNQPVMSADYSDNKTGRYNELWKCGWITLDMITNGFNDKEISDLKKLKLPTNITFKRMERNDEKDENSRHESPSRRHPALANNGNSNTIDTKGTRNTSNGSNTHTRTVDIEYNDARNDFVARRSVMSPKGTLQEDAKLVLLQQEREALKTEVDLQEIHKAIEDKQILGMKKNLCCDECKPCFETSAFVIPVELPKNKKEQEEKEQVNGATEVVLGDAIDAAETAEGNDVDDNECTKDTFWVVNSPLVRKEIEEHAADPKKLTTITLNEEGRVYTWVEDTHFKFVVKGEVIHRTTVGIFKWIPLAFEKWQEHRKEINEKIQKEKRTTNCCGKNGKEDQTEKGCCGKEDHTKKGCCGKEDHTKKGCCGKESEKSGQKEISRCWHPIQYLASEIAENGEFGHYADWQDSKELFTKALEKRYVEKSAVCNRPALFGCLGDDCATKDKYTGEGCCCLCCCKCSRCGELGTCWNTFACTPRNVIVGSAMLIQATAVTSIAGSFPTVISWLNEWARGDTGDDVMANLGGHESTAEIVLFLCSLTLMLWVAVYCCCKKPIEFNY